MNGETDEFGYNAKPDVVHVRDLHATMLHLLGIEHSRFTVEFQGLDSKLTGVESAVSVKALWAWMYSWFDLIPNHLFQAGRVHR